MLRWRLLPVVLSVVLIATGVAVLQLKFASQASAAPTPVVTTPPDLTKWDQDPRARLIGMPGSASNNNYQLLTFEYVLPSGESTGVAVYPGVVFEDGRIISDSLKWPVKVASGQVAQDFMNRTWGQLDEIASNPEGLRALKAMGEASPLPDSSGPAWGFFNVNNPSAPSPVKTVITHAPPGDDYRANKTGKMRASVSLDGSWSGQATGTGASLIEVPDHIAGMYTEEGKLFGMRPATALFHELTHSLRNLLGFSPVDVSQNSVLMEESVPDPTDGSVWKVETEVEEVITHGARSGQKGAFGSEWWSLGLLVKADPYAARSVRIATAAAKAAPGDKNIERTLRVRTAMAGNPVSEVSFVNASPIAQPLRPAYSQPPNLPSARFTLTAGASWDTLTQADFNEPEKSSALVKQQTDPIAPGSACAGSPAVGCFYSSRKATAEEVKEVEEFAAEDEAGKVLQESPDELVVRDLSPDEIRTYARAVVEQGRSDYVAARARGEDLSKFGFTSELQESWKNPGKVFQPFGGSTGVEGKPIGRLSAKLTEGWSLFNTAATPAMVVLWAYSVEQAFRADSSDLTKAAAALGLVPVVGQLLGIADSAINHNPGAITANVLTLLAFSAEFLGFTGAGMILSAAALVAMAVTALVELVTAPSELEAMISGRNAAWRETVNSTLRDKVLPQWLENAQKAFEAAQNNVLLGAYMAMTALDSKAAGSGNSAVVAAAQTAKARIVADTAAAQQALRSGFIDGVHDAIDAAVAALNKGEGSDSFSKTYMEQSVYPQWSRDHFWHYCGEIKSTGDGQTCVDTAATNARMKAVFNRDYVPQVVANVPANQLTADDLRAHQQAVDSKINSGKMFALTKAVDTAPVAPVGFTVCADTSGTCTQDATASGNRQVVFGAAGHYVTAALPAAGASCTASSFVTDPNPSADKMCYIPATDNRTSPDDPSGSRLPVVRTCATEGATCSVTGTHEVAYGTGATWIIKPVTGSVECSNTGFGVDPAPGVGKTCTVLAGAAPGPTVQSGSPAGFCANEAGVCHVSGKVTLAYGANDPGFGPHWVNKRVNGDDYSNGVPCTVDTFGSDPLPGQTKSCHLTRPPAHFSYCAGPGGTCSVPEGGTYQMAYGGDGSWVVKTATSGEHACTDATFNDITRGNVTHMTNTHNYCYLSGPNGDLVLGDTHYNRLNQGNNYVALAAAREGEQYTLTGPVVQAYGDYDGDRGVYYVKPVIPAAGQTATHCNWSNYTSSDPNLRVNRIPHCFKLDPPAPTYDTTQTTFIYPPSTPDTTPPAQPSPSPQPPDSPQPPAPAPGGPITSADGDCLTVNDDHTYVGIADCSNADTQTWRVGTDGTLRTQYGCLDVSDHANGAQAKVQGCGNSSDQVWQSSSDGKLTNSGSGKCLSVSGDRGTVKNQRSPLIIWDCSDPGVTHWNLPTTNSDS